MATAEVVRTMVMIHDTYKGRSPESLLVAHGQAKLFGGAGSNPPAW